MECKGSWGMKERTDEREERKGKCDESTKGLKRVSS